MTGLHALTELRLNDNKISKVTQSIVPCGMLQLLDLGNNRIHEFRY